MGKLIKEKLVQTVHKMFKNVLLPVEMESRKPGWEKNVMMEIKTEKMENVVSSVKALTSVETAKWMQEKPVQTVLRIFQSVTVIMMEILISQTNVLIFLKIKMVFKMRMAVQKLPLLVREVTAPLFNRFATHVRVNMQILAIHFIKMML